MKKANYILGFMLIILLAMTTGLRAQNNCLEFDGTDDYVDFGTNSPSYSSTITIEAWVKTTSSASINNILSWGNSGGSDMSNVQFRTEGGKFEFGMNPQGGGWEVVTSSQDVNTGEWVHLAVVKNGTSVKLYVNGIEDGSGTINNVMTVDRMQIAKYYEADLYFTGAIDEVRIWNDARTKTEIRTNMYRTPVGTDNLVSYYKFDATSGTSLEDETTNNYDGTLYNMDNSDWTLSTAFFGPKNCLDFDGSNDYINCGNNASLTEFNNFTMEAWVKLENSQNDQKILGKFNNWGNYYTMGVGSGVHYTEICANGNKIYFVTGDVPSNEWTHLAVTFSKGNGGANGTFYGYVNGQIVYSKTDVADAAISVSHASYPFRIGICPWDLNHFKVDGQIDEVRIWNVARTEAEIRENMCKTLTGNESGLVAYYNFDNTSGTALQNFSGEDNDGTLQNMDNTDWVNSTAYNSWLDTNSSSWSTAANWSDGVPVSTDNVGIYDYTGGTSPTLSGTPTVNNLVVGSSADLSLSSNVTVNGNLFLYDDLDLNGQTITLGSSATLFESSGNISGATGTIQTIRDLSNIDEDVAGLGAEITEDGNLGSTTIIRGHAAQGSQGIKRYYRIIPSNAPTNATLVFNYLDAELNGVTEVDLKLFKSADGNDWIVQSSSIANTTDNTVTLTGINSFSWWTAGDGDGPLPVNLSSFYALYISGTPTLYWTTQTETDNAYWNVYRGTNDSFEEASHINANNPIAGNGTTNSASDYVYIDNAPVVQNTTYWYWIEDVSTDGETEIHEPINLSIPFEDTPVTPEDYGLHQNYPNPFNPSTSISFALAEESDVELIIYNIKGEKIKSIFNDHIYADQITIAVWDGKDANGKDVSTGVYFYKLITDTKEYQKKMLMVK